MSVATNSCDLLIIPFQLSEMPYSYRYQTMKQVIATDVAFRIAEQLVLLAILSGWSLKNFQLYAIPFKAHYASA